MELSFLSIALLAFIPAGLWLFIYYLKDKVEPEPLRVVWRTFYYGMMAAVPLLVFQVFTRVYPNHEPLTVLSRYIENPIVVYILLFALVAAVEEYIKHVGLTVVDDEYPHTINQVVDGIIYAVAAACGFAFLENMAYFFRALGSGLEGTDLLVVFGIRALGSTLAHTVFSGAFGYFYGKAKLEKDIIHRSDLPLYKFLRHLGQAWKLHIIRTHVMLKRPSDKGHDATELVAEGFFIAFFLHFTYNLLLSAEIFGSVLSPLAIPLVYLGFFFLTRAFLNQSDTAIATKARLHLKKLATLPELRKNIVSLSDLNR